MSSAEVLAACRSLAIAIRKCRDVCQGALDHATCTSMATQMGAHVGTLMDGVGALDEDAHAGVHRAAAQVKQLALAMVQLLARLATDDDAALKAKLATLNTALAGKVKVLHESCRALDPSPAQTPHAHERTVSLVQSNPTISSPRSPFSASISALPMHSASDVSSSGGTLHAAVTPIKSLAHSTPGKLSPRGSTDGPIDVGAASDIVKQLKDVIYNLLDAYKSGNDARVDVVMNELIAKGKKLVAIGGEHDPDAKSLVKVPLRKIDKGLAKPGNEATLQAHMKEFHRVTRDLVQRFNDINCGRSPNPSSGARSTRLKSSGSAPGNSPGGQARGRRATVASSLGLVDALGEVNKLVGENTKRDPTELLTMEKELGKGAFGSVWKAIAKTGHVFAVKMVPISMKTLQTTIKEIKTMQARAVTEIKHPNTLEYFTCYKKETEIWIVMEYCDAGSVQDALMRRDCGLEEPVIASITKQVLAGVKYIHSLQKLHRDIKSGNLLLTTKAEVKIADFGTAAEADVRRTTVIGSSFWMAPETLDQRGYDSKADIWSLGITLIEMAEKDPPYFDLQPHQFSSEFVEFLRFCLQKEPRKRFSAASLESHAWITKSDNNHLLHMVNPSAARQRTSRIRAATSPIAPSLLTPTRTLADSSTSSSPKLSDKDVDAITSNIILPPVDIESYLKPEGALYTPVRSDDPAHQRLSTHEDAKNKKSMSDRRPSKHALMDWQSRASPKTDISTSPQSPTSESPAPPAIMLTSVPPNRPSSSSYQVSRNSTAGARISLSQTATPGADKASDKK